MKTIILISVAYIIRLLGMPWVPNLHHLEEKHVYTYAQQPLMWKIFIDDIFLIWTYSMQDLYDFIFYQDNCDPTIKFTQEVSYSRVLFLDLLIYKSD